ncbi:MAG: hypothetical protein IJV64_03180 [Oscillospiraceae bacterium]|nr:hypothetical protein [Oscillospiraceae bacterium]
MKRVLCLGDSNTFGYDPRSYFGAIAIKISQPCAVFPVRVLGAVFLRAAPIPQRADRAEIVDELLQRRLERWSIEFILVLRPPSMPELCPIAPKVNPNMANRIRIGLFVV